MVPWRGEQVQTPDTVLRKYCKTEFMSQNQVVHVLGVKKMEAKSSVESVGRLILIHYQQFLDEECYFALFDYLENVITDSCNVSFFKDLAGLGKGSSIFGMSWS